jgi:peptidoglycan/xylan/chitin deacetylase (PgdA/CDA1 family)
MLRITIKRLGRPIVSSIAHLSGYTRVASSVGWNHGARILSYHGVMDSPDNPYAVSTEIFERQMEHLAEQYTLLSVDRIVDLIREGRSIPSGAVAITFDDGDESVYTNAFPILKRLGIPATIFLPVEFIGATVSIRTISPRRQAAFMSWDQVREMSAHGIVFGSHTMSHVSMTRVSLHEAKSQLTDSKAELERQIDQLIAGFAYPYGTVRDFNFEVERLVEASGYSWAVTVLSGLNHHGSDLFALRRTKVERWDSMTVFVRAMKGALDPWIVADRLGAMLR